MPVSKVAELVPCVLRLRISYEAGDQRRDVPVAIRGDGTGGNVGDKNTTVWGASYTLRFRNTGFSGWVSIALALVITAHRHWRPELE